jgi:hypothetical protein
MGRFRPQRTGPRTPAITSPRLATVSRQRPDFEGASQGAPLVQAWVVSALMTAADRDLNGEHESTGEDPDPAAEPPTRLREAAAGIAEAQAWKGQQIAKGWRKLVGALRRPRPPSP